MVQTKCEIYTRCVGYLRPIDSMNDSKQAEVHDRNKFDSSILAYRNTWKAQSIKRRNLLLEKFGGKCQNLECNSTEELQFAHLKQTSITGMGRGKYWRIKDVELNPDAYALLCKNCHHAFDRDQLMLPVVVKTWLPV